MTAPASGITPSRARLFVLAVGLAIVVFDQLTKIWALTALDTGPRRVVGEVIGFRLVRNPGAAFGSFTGAGPILGIIAVAATVWVFVYAGRLAAGATRSVWWPLVGLGFIAGGAVGNVIDRLAREPHWMRGEVIDFVELPRWPVFNVADSAVVVGVILVIISLPRAMSRGKPAHGEVEPGTPDAPRQDTQATTGHADDGGE